MVLIRPVRELEILEAFARPAAREHGGFELRRRPTCGASMRRIDAALEREAAWQRSAAGFRRWAANSWAGRLRPSVVVLALAAAWLMQVVEQPVYRTLTAPMFPGDGHYLRVVFDPGVPAAGIDERLSVHGLTQENGPSARGVLMRCFDEAADASERAAALAALRADQAVLFVQPVGADGSQ